MLDQHFFQQDSLVAFFFGNDSQQVWLLHWPRSHNGGNTGRECGPRRRGHVQRRVGLRPRSHGCSGA
jgi:hypothetical protein